MKANRGLSARAAEPVSARTAEPVSTRTAEPVLWTGKAEVVRAAAARVRQQCEVR